MISENDGRVFGSLKSDRIQNRIETICLYVNKVGDIRLIKGREEKNHTLRYKKGIKQHD